MKLQSGRKEIIDVENAELQIDGHMTDRAAVEFDLFLLQVNWK